MPRDLYTYLKDVRPRGDGTAIPYKPLAALVDLCMGELVGWDADDKALVRFTRDGATNVKFVGISRDSQVGMARLGNYPALALKEISVFSTGVHSLLGTAAETYVHGTIVYMSGTDTQKITTVVGVGGVAIGTVHLPDGSTLTGAVLVPVLIDEYTLTQI